MTSPAQAQRKCNPTGKPKIEYQLDVPAKPGSDVMVRVQLASEYCEGANSGMGYSRWRVLDARGRLLQAADREIIPLSAKHGVIELAFAKTAMQRFGQRPGPELPYPFPSYLNAAFYPGIGSVKDFARPVVIAPMVVSVLGSAQGSTIFSAAVFTGHSYEPRIFEGLGGKAIFGTETFGREFRGVTLNNLKLEDFVMPRQGALTFQNLTAPDGSAISVMLDRAGEPIGTAIGLVELIRVPEIQPGRNGGRSSPLGQLVSRMGPLGSGFPGKWLYVPIDRSGEVIPPLQGSIGYTLLREGDANDPPLWAAVYKGADGPEVALAGDYSGQLPAAVRQERYTSLVSWDVQDDLTSYALVGRSPANGQWSVIDYLYNQPRPGAANSFATAQAGMAAVDNWARLRAADDQRQRIEWGNQRAASEQRAAAEARAQAIAKFESDYPRRGWGCFDGYYSQAAYLGDAYVKRWFEKCGVPTNLYGEARQLGVGQDVLARSDQMAASRRAYYDDLRRRGAAANAFTNAIAAYRANAGSVEADPWVAVRVTEGGRTTTQVMRQSSYDARRP